MKHEIIGLGGRRLIIKPDPLNAGMVHVAVYSRDDAFLEGVSLVWPAAAVASDALHRESEAAFAMGRKPIDIGTDWQKVNEVARGVA